MKMGKIVYRLHGPENMIFSYVYIGSTELPIKVRFNQHLNDAIYYKRNTKLCQAIREYNGWYIRRIEYVADDGKAAERENFWMEWFREQGYTVLNMRKSNQSLICGYH